MFQRVIFPLFFCLSLFSLLTPGYAQSNAFLITYGSDAGTSEGDDDFTQVIFITIPTALTDSLYLRVLDADCGGARDALYGGVWDTQTKFSFFGGAGAYSTASAQRPHPDRAELKHGNLIAELTIGEDSFKDDRWFTLASFDANAGEIVGDLRYFRLNVEGLNGNDGNIFDVTVSAHPRRNIAVKDLNIFTFSPTLRLPSADIISEIRFNPPANGKSVTIHNFDVSGGSVSLETAFRSNLAIPSSAQDDWAEGSVDFNEAELNRKAAINFSGGLELPNDATFYATDSDGNPLALDLPVFIHAPNARPVINLQQTQLTDFGVVMFDASASSDLDNDPMTFYWSFSDGSTDTGSRVLHTFSKAGEYSAHLIVEDASGTIGNATAQTFPVYINDPPVANAGNDITSIAGEKIVFDGSGSFDNDGKIVRYLWNFGDGSRAEGAKVKHSFSKPGDYTVTLRVEDNSDSPLNFGSDDFFVWINSAPIVDIGPDLIASPDEPVQLSGANSYDSDGQITAYDWNLGDGAKQSGMNISHSYSKPATYKVTLVVTDDANVKNSSASDELLVVVNDPPVAVASSHRDVVSPLDVVKFDASRSIDRDGKLIRYSWDFGDGSSDEGAKVKHAYAGPGTYTISLEIQDNSQSSSDLDHTSIEVVVNDTPVAMAGADQMVTSSLVHFDAGASYDPDGFITAYRWDFGDGGKSDKANPTHVFANPGVYNVELTVTDNSGTSTENHSDDMTVTINSSPIADAGPDMIAMPGQQLTFEGGYSIDPDGEISRYLWDFGDGNSAEGMRAQHSYVHPGTYSVSLTVWDATNHANARDNDQINVVVNAPPKPQAGVNLRVAPGEQFTLDGGLLSSDSDGEIIAYRWEFSDGSDTIGKTRVKKSFREPGLYTARLIVTDNSGAGNAQADDTVEIYVNHAPHADLGSDILSSRLTLEFDGSQSGDPDGDELKYSWNFGDGSPIAHGIRLKHTFPKAGDYPVVLTVDDQSGLANAMHTASINVAINAAPIADAGKDLTVCAGDVVLFDGGNSSDLEEGLLKYHWDFGDGETGSGVNPTKTYTRGGTFLVTLTVRDDSGLEENVDQDQAVVRVAESPVAVAGPNQTVCANTEVHFDGSQSRDFDGLVNGYLWDFGDGSEGGGPTPTHVYTTPGQYSVTLTVTGDRVGQCDNQDTDDLIVIVDEAPIARIEGVSQVAKGMSTTFDGSGSEALSSKIIFYRWDFGDSIYDEGEKVAHTYTNAGRYFVKLTVQTDSETQCNATTTSMLVVVNDAPIAVAGNDVLTGVNQAVRLNGSKSNDPDGIISRYQWDFGDGETAEGVSAVHYYKAPGRYDVKLAVLDNTDLENNHASDQLTVIVNAAPVPVIDCPARVACGEIVNFSGAKSVDSDGQIVSYVWQIGSEATQSGKSVSHSFSRPGNYIISLTVDDGQNVANSSAEATIEIIVNDPPVADAGVDKITCPGEFISFDGSRSFDRDGRITKYEWDFGDGKNEEGGIVAHAWDKAGLYTVFLTVTDESETSSSTAKDNCHVRVNTAPVADAGSDQSGWCGGAHDAVVFDASGSSDADGDALTYFWDFGDKSTATGKQAYHSYSTPGEYTVRLRVSDGVGVKNSEVWDDIKIIVRAHDE